MKRHGIGGAATVVACIVGAASLWLMTPVASAAPSCTPSGTNIVCTFSTVGTELFTIPAGVTQVTVDAFGAQGGGTPGIATGGLGGEGIATVSVTAGQILQVNVGGQGGAYASALPNGGVNGGGSGGSGTDEVPEHPDTGPGGGGASDVRTTPYGLADRLVVGGGGGGSGNYDGGAGGGTTGGTQTGIDSSSHGQGGTQTSGGAAASGGGGTGGVPGVGGTGGSSSGSGGAGGGGGYFGGGGGAGFSGGFRGSGGGGSGLGTTVNGGVRSGNGLVTITYAGAELRVVKQLSPAADPGLFNLQIDGVTQAANVGNGGDTGFKTVNPGTHTVGETAGTVTVLADYGSGIVCTVGDGNGGGTVIASGTDAGPLTVTALAGSQTVCTITNIRKTGELRVIKDLEPADDPGLFNLQIDGTTQTADAGDGGDTGLKTLNTGTHTVGETAGTATTLSDYASAIVCKANNGTGATVASGSGAGPLNVPVGRGDQIACTITNTRNTGQLRVIKDLEPADDPGLFNLQIDGTTQVADAGDGGNTGLKTVNTGTHTVGETAGTATALSDYTSTIVCKASDGTGATVASGSAAGPLNVPVTTGDQIACTITNTRHTGQLRVVKDLTPGAAPGKFNLQIDGTTQAANVGDGGDTGLKTLNTGTHTVGETAGTATALADYNSAIVCKANDGTGATVAAASGAGPLNVPVTSDDQIACTISNTLTNLVPTQLSTNASAGVVLGGSVRDTATLANGHSPTGQITFRLYGPGDANCSGTPVFTDTVAITGNGTYDSTAFTPTAAGKYRWIATYSGDEVNRPAAGSCDDANEAVTVSEPLAAPVNPAITVTGVELHRQDGTATLTVETTVAGPVRIAETKKVRAFGPIELDQAGSAELEVAARPGAARKLRRDGRVRVNPRALLGLTGGAKLGVRHALTLRLD